MPDVKVEVLGLRDLQVALRAADRDFPKQLRLANKDAAEVIASATRRSFSSRGGVAPKVAPSVKALAQQRNASVKVGGNRYPYAMGSMFGSQRFRQFPPFKKGGYSLFPQIKEKRAEVVDAYEDALKRLIAKAF